MTRYDEAYFKNIGVLLEEILEHESNKMEESLLVAAVTHPSSHKKPIIVQEGWFL